MREEGMSKWDKLIRRLMSLDKDLRFEELCRILESYGYSMTTPGGGSSHAVFRKKGKNPITIPRHRPIKKIYIELVRDVVEEENRHENDR